MPELLVCWKISCRVIPPRVFSGGGSLNEPLRHGIPIGNLTSQLFANVYMDAFDHFIKAEIKKKYYLRYTDDAVILADTHSHLAELVAWIEAWLWRERRLELHPRKTEIRKLRQGIDFLGYVTLPHHRVLRAKSKRRMLKRVNQTNVASYFGLLGHCSGFSLQDQLLQNLPP